MRVEQVPAQVHSEKKPPASVECPMCGRPAHSVEAQRRRELARQDRCRCDAYPFPHRRGTIVACRFHPDRLAGIPMSDDEMSAYQATMERDRTAWNFGVEIPTAQDKIKYLPEAPF